MNSEERDALDRKHDRNVERRRAFVKRWAEYVRTHPDEEWSRQQNVVIDSQVPEREESQPETTDEP
jgi:hypothetical protein